MGENGDGAKRPNGKGRARKAAKTQRPDGTAGRRMGEELGTDDGQLTADD
jgi:hypothetical protein